MRRNKQASACSMAHLVEQRKPSLRPAETPAARCARGRLPANARASAAVADDGQRAGPPADVPRPHPRVVPDRSVLIAVPALARFPAARVSALSGRPLIPPRTRTTNAWPPGARRTMQRLLSRCIRAHADRQGRPVCSPMNRRRRHAPRNEWPRAAAFVPTVSRADARPNAPQRRRGQAAANTVAEPYFWSRSQADVRRGTNPVAQVPRTEPAERGPGPERRLACAAASSASGVAVRLCRAVRSQSSASTEASAACAAAAR